MIGHIGFHRLLTYGSRNEIGVEINWFFFHRVEACSRVESTPRFQEFEKIFFLGINYSGTKEKDAAREKEKGSRKELWFWWNRSTGLEPTQNFTTKCVCVASEVGRVFFLSCFVGYTLYIQSTCFRPLTWYILYTCIFSLGETAISFSMKVA